MSSSSVQSASGLVAALFYVIAGPGWVLLGLFVLFPATFFGANFGAGSAVIVAIHAAHVSQVAVYLCTVLSIVFAVTLVRFAAAFVPGSELVAAADRGMLSERHQASSSPRTMAARHRA